MGQGLLPLTGEAQGVLLLGAFGKRGGQTGGAPGHLCAPSGEAQPSPGSFGGHSIRDGPGPRQDHHICEFPASPLSAPLKQGPQQCKLLPLQAPGRGSSHQDKGAGRRLGTQRHCRPSRRDESSSGCRCCSSHCRETRGSTPLEAHHLGQGREPGVSGHWCQLAEGAPSSGGRRPCQGSQPSGQSVGWISAPTCPSAGGPCRVDPRANHVSQNHGQQDCPGTGI